MELENSILTEKTLNTEVKVNVVSNVVSEEETSISYYGYVKHSKSPIKKSNVKSTYIELQPLTSHSEADDSVTSVPTEVPPEEIAASYHGYERKSSGSYSIGKAPSILDETSDQNQCSTCCIITCILGTLGSVGAAVAYFALTSKNNNNEIVLPANNSTTGAFTTGATTDMLSTAATTDVLSTGVITDRQLPLASGAVPRNASLNLNHTVTAILLLPVGILIAREIVEAVTNTLKPKEAKTTILIKEIQLSDEQIAKLEAVPSRLADLESNIELLEKNEHRDSKLLKQEFEDVMNDYVELNLQDTAAIDEYLSGLDKFANYISICVANSDDFSAYIKDALGQLATTENEVDFAASKGFTNRAWTAASSIYTQVSSLFFAPGKMVKETHAMEAQQVSASSHVA